MRVVHVVSHLGTYGGERFVEALVRAQLRAGIAAEIATIYDSFEPEGVRVHSCARAPRGIVRGGGPAFFFRLVRLIRRLEPEIVHTHLAHAKYWGRLAAIAAGAPHVVHTEHANAWHASMAKRLLACALNRRTDAIVALTHAQAARLARYDGASPDRIVVIPNGIEPVPSDRLSENERESTRRALGVPPGARLILCVGRLEPVKGYDRALEALALLPADHHLAIAGEGSLRETLLAQAGTLGVRDRVHALGYRDDTSTLLACADLVLNTSRSEAMPLSLLEALWVGVPVVATPWPGASEVLGAARVAEGSCAREIAASVTRALRAPSPDRWDVENVREAISIDTAARRYAALYADIVHRHARARGAGDPILLK